MGNSTNSDEVASAANRHASLVYDCIDGNPYNMVERFLSFA